MTIRFFWLVTLAATLQAHEPITTKITFTQEISRIFYKRCASCHRQGGTAMSLMSYEEARPWATAIREEVLERRMPPWGAVKGFGEFRDDPSLLQPEIDMIVSWIEGGAPKGEEIYLPSQPRFDSPVKTRVPASHEISVEGSRIFNSDTTAVSIAPRRLPAGGSMELTAYLPDGAVQHLIWLRNYREEWKHTYVFRDPLNLPKGTRVAMYAPAGSEAVISVQRRAR